MILTMTLIIAALVIVNFLLLRFSVNRIDRPAKVTKKPVVLNPELFISTDSENLAPTGS